MNIDLIDKILENIHDAILWTKVSVANNKFLSAQEMNTITNLMYDQGLQVELPDEALSLVKPKVAVNKDTLLYILRIPQLDKEEANILELHPLINNDSVIQDSPPHLIRRGNELFTTIKPEEYVQRSNYISKYSDECISKLILGKQSFCVTRRENKTETRLITDNLIIVNNARLLKLQSNCGPDDRLLKGNFLISFSNCNITIGDIQFISADETIHLPILQGAMHGALTHHRLEEDSMSYINNQTIANRKLIDHVYLNQYAHQFWNWSLLGGLSFSTTLIISLAIFTLIYYRKTVRYIITKFTKDNGDASTQNRNA